MPRAVTRVGGPLGLLLLLAFGYFATTLGGSAALHGWPVLLALGGVILSSGPIAEQRKHPDRILSLDDASRERVVRLREVGTRWLYPAAPLFAIEVMLPDVRWRVCLGAAALVLALIGGAFLARSLQVLNRGSARPRA